MSSRAGSTFVTFLMSIPVAAAGMVAFFGVPPLSSVIAATRGLNDKLQSLSSEDNADSRSSSTQFEEWDGESAPSWDQGGTEETPSPSSRRKDREVDDLGFSKFPEGDAQDQSSDEGSTPTKNGSRKRRPDTAKRDAFAWRDDASLLGKAPSAEGVPSTNSENSNSRSRNVSDSQAAPPLSMKESLKKLNSLGVKHYHLERGADQDTWLFVCLFSPGDDSRVTHRFEAESADPEGAVTETLKQIDSWLLKRFRDKQPISQTAL